MEPNTNKYLYLKVLQGNYGYGHGWEDLSAEDLHSLGARKRIKQTRREYYENEGGCYRIIERREKNPNFESAVVAHIQ